MFQVCQGLDVNKTSNRRKCQRVACFPVQKVSLLERKRKLSGKSMKNLNQEKKQRLYFHNN